jgi:murein L,D-transpeptidase YcbB/YkuD
MAETRRRPWRAAAALALIFAAAGGAQPIAAPPARWSAADIQQLLEAVEASDAEGLQPRDYDLPELVTALIDGSSNMDRLADHAALALAHDLNEGAATQAERLDWHIGRPRMDYPAWLDGALARHQVKASFAALLPTDKAYGELKAALADCRAAGQDCRRFEINLDRWRALPRDLGSRYLWVNVPAFRLDLISNGEVVSSHRIIVGKPSSRTPLFKAQVTGITVNPWWNVPCSIVDESIGRLLRRRPKEAARRGYVASRGAGGRLTVRQKPGPQNALGQIKLEMPNPYDVYIHDTPTKELFASDVRAFSHGCVRTENPLDLAQALLGDGRKSEIELLLLTGKTKTLSLPAPVPVYVVYMTAELDPTDNDRLRVHDDVYGRDAQRL